VSSLSRSHSPLVYSVHMCICRADLAVSMHVPGLLKLFSEKCVCVCVCMSQAKFYIRNSRVKSSSFVTTVRLKKFDAYCTLRYFKQNKLPRRSLKSGKSPVEPKFQNGRSPTCEKMSYKKTQMIYGFILI